ncbi:hypothetical protein RJT34_11963 [Clitoria ternatea]|uniref:NAB domain-containing protein n=1 Tax=Clitoria ternatea TaxID=43366 RepID=A0AAN9JLC7_CLITE
MLQRAASNAYSWWWASHIRTKQSKWLDQSLQDMEEKVNETLRILRYEGDSFGQRAEMYYKNRPELVNFVEEAFRAYKSLSERYDHLSRELQSANRTLASVFPDQVPCQIDDDDDDESYKGTNAPPPDQSNEAQNKATIPKVPKIPKKVFGSSSMLLSRKGTLKRTISSAKYVPSSGLTKDEALAEIDRIQKEILALQTEKEFVRSLYERAYEKYWEIEDSITGMQKRVYGLQDEFGVGTVIEDNDARTLMAATALRSCHDTLLKLQEIQEQSSKEAKVEYERVKKAHEKFETLRDQFISKFTGQHSEIDENKRNSGGTEHRCIDEQMDRLEQEEHDVGKLREKIKQKLEQDSGNSFTMVQMAECIDELVNKVVTLETVVSRQTGMVKRLRSYTDELQKNIRRLEDENEMLIEGSEAANKKLKELEEELWRVKMLKQSVKTQDNSLQTHFTEASCSLEHLSGKLNNMKPDFEDEDLVLYKKKKIAIDGQPGKNSYVKTITEDDGASDVDSKKSNVNASMNGRMIKLIQQDKDDLSDTVSSLDIEPQDLDTGEENQPNWRQMFISGLDDREKILLEEYTSVLRDYKDVRTKLNDVEKKNRDSIFELALQLRELKTALVTKDKEIQILNQKLDSSPDGSPYTMTTEYKYTPNEALLRKEDQAANDELQGRYSSLCNIQDEIARAGETEPGADEEKLIRKYQAAKFQGEILNMKQENSKVASELQAGLSLVKGMKNDVEKTLEELDEAIGVHSNNSDTNNNNKGHMRQSSRARIPLRSFLFGVKLKRQKNQASSLFACVNPALQRQHSFIDQAPAPI